MAVRRQAAAAPSARLLQRGRVDAVALAGRRWSVLEDMTEVASAAAAMHLDPLHSVARVARRGDGARVGRTREAGPARPAVELLLGAEELRAATRAEIAAGLVIVPELAAEGALGARLSEHAGLLERQLAAPLIIALVDRVVHGCW